MALTLSITNVPRLENGVSTTLVLDRNGAVIGRSAMADWSLPDPQSFISSTHCEIDYRNGGYVLTDKSLNGTLINGGPDRMAGPHKIADGDVIIIGHYEISCRLDGADRAADLGARSEQAPATPSWSGWDRPAAAPAASSDWGSAPAASSGWGSAAAAKGGAASVWSAPPEERQQASAWSSPVADKPSPAGGNIWEQLATNNVVDWARAGFGADRRDLSSLPAAPPPAPAAPAAPAAPSKDPFGLGQPSPSNTWGEPASPAERQPASSDWGAASSVKPEPAPTPSQPPPPPTVAPRAAPEPPPRPASTAQDASLWSAFLAASGVSEAEIASAPETALAAAGGILRQMIAGLVVLLEARARAKAQLGAQGTALELQGNNPLKFARTPEAALAQVLNPPQRGFMSAERAVEDAFRDLQAHQMATLAAMQGALAATLERFSPDAIRERAESHGILAKILPGAHEAELWRAYEREFEGVSRGSDEAFMDVFAKEFKAAYERAAAQGKGK